MNDVQKYISLELVIKDKVIVKIFDLKNKNYLKSFLKPLTEKRYKLYVIKSHNEFLYVGITKQSLRNRLRSGLSSDGIHGYHGYKWKNHKSIQLYVWCFDNFNEEQLENIEAELVYLIRNKTNNWPLFQNEIHFNNNFTEGKIIASQIFKILTIQ